MMAKKGGRTIAARRRMFALVSASALLMQGNTIVDAAAADRARSNNLRSRNLAEYDGKIVLGPQNEEVDIYEKKEKPAPEQEEDISEKEAKELQAEKDKLLADLAKLEELDTELKEEIAEENEDGSDPDTTMVTAQVEPQDAMDTDSPTAAPAPVLDESDEVAKLKADLAKLEHLDDELKAQMKEEEGTSPKEVEPQQQVQEKNSDDEKLQEEVTKLKNDLKSLEALDQELQEEIAEEDEDANKPSKADTISKLHSSEQAITEQSHQTIININERDAIELAAALENAVASCRDQSAIQPPNSQREEDSSTGTTSEAELEISYEKACCVPPLYNEYCTPTQPREWCDMRLTCLEADRLRDVFLNKVQDEINAADKACREASDAAGGQITEHNVEMKCCLPPYDAFLPECIDRTQRSKRREANKCDSGLEKCVEVKMLKDLKYDTVGVTSEDEDNEEDEAAGTSTVAGGGDMEDEVQLTPEITEHHTNIADSDEGYAYSQHIGGREKEGKGMSLGYKKKEEFHKEDHFVVGPKTMMEMSGGRSVHGIQNLWLVSTCIVGVALFILGW